MIHFNPLTDKSPKGALTNQQQAFYTVWVPQDFYVKEIHIEFTEEFTQKKLTFPLTETGVLQQEDRQFQVEVPPLEVGLYFYDFLLVFDDATGYLRNEEFDAQFTMNRQEFSSWQLTVYDAQFQTPDWFKGGIMYQIFPDRFKKSDAYTATPAANEAVRVRHAHWDDIPYSPITHPHYHAEDFFMGNLKGIEEELEYLKDLHVTSMYLNPIVESPENHRYSTADYFAVDPYLGDLSDFQSLVAKSTKKDIHIILDGVFSHTGADSKYFNRYGHYDTVGAYQSVDSPYYDWYSFLHYPDTYQSWWGFTNLPTVVKENQQYQQFMFAPHTGVINFWQRLGISGWRIDVADEFPDEFLDQLRTAAKREDPDCFIVGEVWEDATTKFSYNTRRRYLLGKQLDSVMNYPWKDAILTFVKDRDAQKFSVAISTIIENYPKPALDVVMNLLSSHDTVRAITTLAFDDPEAIPVQERPKYTLSPEQYTLAKERFKLASFLQFTLPGVPSIYYGDEIGMYGFRDPYNRNTFQKDKIDSDLLHFFKELTAFRRKFPEAFKEGTFEWEKIERHCIAFKRDGIHCIVNTDDAPHLLSKITGEILFETKSSTLSPYGIIVPAQSVVALGEKR